LLLLSETAKAHITVTAILQENSG